MPRARWFFLGMAILIFGVVFRLDAILRSKGVLSTAALRPGASESPPRRPNQGPSLPILAQDADRPTEIPTPIPVDSTAASSQVSHTQDGTQRAHSGDVSGDASSEKDSSKVVEGRWSWQKQRCWRRWQTQRCWRRWRRCESGCGGHPHQVPHGLHARRVVRNGGRLEIRPFDPHLQRQQPPPGPDAPFVRTFSGPAKQYEYRFYLNNSLTVFWPSTIKLTVSLDEEREKDHKFAST